MLGWMISVKTGQWRQGLEDAKNAAGRVQKSTKALTREGISVKGLEKRPD